MRKKATKIEAPVSQQTDNETDVPEEGPPNPEEENQEMEEVTDGDEQSTTARLFPELIGESEESEEVVPSEEDVSGEQQTELEQDPSEEEVVADYLDIKGLGEKRVKVKIDGVESDVPLSDVIKGYQTDQHLTLKGQAVAKDKGLLELLVSKLQPQGDQQRPQQTVSESKRPPAIEDEFTRQEIQPHLDYYEGIINKQSEAITQLISRVEGLGPVQYKSDLEELDAELKGEGFDDFLTFVPKIEAEVQSLPEARRKQMRSLDGFKQLYYFFKAKDMTNTLSKPSTKPDSKKIVNVERSSSRSSGSGTSTKRARQKKSFETAKSTGSTRDWGNVIRDIEEE